MIDTHPYFVDNAAKCTYFPMDYGEALGYRNRLPLDIFELYITLLPFYCSIRVLE
jgi:hypothetical protein